MKTTAPKLGPFVSGMSNRREDYALSGNEEEGALLRDAINVDVSKQGRLRRRPGFERLISGSFLHSLWAPPSGEYGLYMSGGSLMKIGANGSAIAVKTGLLPNQRMSFAHVNGDVFFSNGINKGSLAGAWGSAPVAWGDRTLDPMPAGQHICYGANRLYVATGNTVYYSVPFAAHLMDAASNFVQFPSRVTMLVAVPAGLFIGADKTYFAAGGLPAEMLSVAAKEPPVEWSVSYDPDTETAAWMSPRGITIGTPGGEVQTPQEKEIAVSAADTGSSAFRERDGMRQIIGSLIDPGQTGAAVSGFMNARLVRKGFSL